MIALEPLFLTLKLATLTTILLFVLSIPLAYCLAFSKFKFKPILETLVSMPLILPPSVLGFYLLLAFSPANSFGMFIENYFGLRLVFSFEGLVIASLIYSLPFMVHPIQSGFKSISSSLIEASCTLGKGRIMTLFKILLPNIKSSLLTGLVITFAHTIGEFGVVLMIGGNIPGETKVASIAIYDEVEAMNYTGAHIYALILFVLSFVILLTVYLLNNKAERGYRLW
jgi:molybdate transport system permease protein